MYGFMVLVCILFVSMFACEYCPTSFPYLAHLRRHNARYNGTCTSIWGFRDAADAATGMGLQHRDRGQAPSGEGSHDRVTGQQQELPRDDHDELEEQHEPSSSLDSTFILGRWAQLACNGTGIPAADLQSLLDILHHPQFDPSQVSAQ